MTLLLHRLACQRCGACFWPAEAPWATWILCPSCGGPHANTRGVDRTPRGHFGRIGGPAGPALLAWMDRFWPDLLPPIERYGSTVSVKVETGTRGGFPFAIEKTSVHPNAPPLAHILVAAFSSVRADAPRSETEEWKPPDMMKLLLLNTSQARMKAMTPPPPASAERTEPGPIYLGFGPAGAWAYTETARGTLALLTNREAWVDRLVEMLVARGAEPPLPMVPAPPGGEVAPPSHHDDVAESSGAAEARTLRCATCGAGFSAAAVVGGGLCPFCAAQLALEPGVAAEIDSYRRRVAAYQLRSRTQLEPDKLWAQASPDGLVLSCGSCGAPNAHAPGRLDETCAYCGLAMVPETGVMDLAVSRVAKAAQAEHAAAGRRLDRSGRAWDQFMRGHLLFTGAVLGMSAVCYAFYLPFVVFAVHEAFGPLASALCVLAPLVALGVGGPLLIRQRRAKQKAWDDAYRALADQLGGRIGDLDVLQRWLPRFWRDSFPIGAFRSGSFQGAVAFTLATLPMVLEADPRPTAGSQFTMTKAAPARAMVLAAGRLPTDSPRRLESGPAAETHAALDRCGFLVELHTGGLLVKAKPEAIAILREAPTRLAALGPVAFAAARLAHQLGIQPVAAA